MPELRDRIAHLIDELKRRCVLRVAAFYLVAAWAAIQVSDVTFPRLGMPDWTVTFVIVFLAAMFPVAVGLVGERERALVTLRRRTYTPWAFYWVNELNGEQARVADALGRREEAIRAYRAYLAHMRNPEPPFDARARQAQARLEALLGDEGQTR